MFLVLAAALAAGQSSVLILEHATVIDATGAPPQVDVAVVVRGGLIERIGANVEAPPEAVVIDASGKFVIPGLWDMHVHMPGLRDSFRALVAHGITGVREMYSGAEPALYDPWRTLPGAPRMVVPGMLDAPVRPPSAGAVQVRDAEEARAGVRWLAANRAEFIKVYSSLSREAYFAAAEEARRIGIPFAGHVPEAVSPAEAAEAGQLSQEHLINILLAASTREQQLREERLALLRDPALSVMERARRFGWPRTEGLFDTYDPDKAARLFALFADYGIWHTPTLVVSKYYAAPEGRALPMLEGLEGGDLAAFTARVQRWLDRHVQLVGDMHRAGVLFLAGSDAGAATGLPLGVSLHEELELLVAAGMTPLEALQTATRNPALYFGVLTLMGTVEPGKSADMVVLDANPLEDIRNTRRIHGVMLRGTYYSRAALDQMLAAIGQ